jgi:hypothetical protein
MDGDAVSQCNCIGRWFLGGRLHGLVLRGWVGGIVYVFALWKLLCEQRTGEGIGSFWDGNRVS